jgi:hypothetical protein
MAAIVEVRFILFILDIDISPWKNPSSSDPLNIETSIGTIMKSSTRSINYIAALTNPLGPKSTKCIGEETLLNASSSSFCVYSTSETPDIPSGNCFLTHSIVCVYQDGGDVRVGVWWKVEWRRSSWLRIPIEMGVEGGLREYWRVLDKGIREWVDRGEQEGIKIGEGITENVRKSSEEVVVEKREVSDEDVEWLMRVVWKGVGVYWREVLGVGVFAFVMQLLILRVLMYSIV